MLGCFWKGFGMVSEEPLNKFGMMLESILDDVGKGTGRQSCSALFSNDSNSHGLRTFSLRGYLFIFFLIYF